MTEDNPETLTENEAADYRDEVLARKHDQDSKFENGILIVAGGAFTISATFMTGEFGQLRWLGILMVAWALWGTSLYFVLRGYRYSSRQHQDVLDMIAAGEPQRSSFAAVARGPQVEAANVAALRSLIAGFLAFGIFAAVNLYTGGSEVGYAQEDGHARTYLHEEGDGGAEEALNGGPRHKEGDEEDIQEEGGQEEGGQEDMGVQRTAPGTSADETAEEEMTR